MSNLHFHSDPNLAADIEAYLSGNMSAAEMHRLEKAMLDDPFLTDAVEGLGLIENEAKRQAALKVIRQQIGAGKEQNFIGVYQRYAAAAAIILMLGTVYLLKDTFLSNQGNELALSEAQKEEMEEVIAPEESEEALAEKDIIDEQEEALLQSGEPNLSARSKAQEDKVATKAETYAQSQPIQNQQRSFSSASEIKETPLAKQQIERAEENSALQKNAEVLEEAPILEFEADDDISDFAFNAEEEINEAIAGNKMEDTLRIAQQEAIDITRTKSISARSKKLGRQLSDELPTASTTAQRQITGTITDTNKNPLPGVSVLVKGTQQGTVTDLDGKFVLTASTEDRLLYVNYIGFESEEVTLEEGDNEMEIAIDEDLESLSEVVVSAYGTQKTGSGNQTGSVTTLDRKALGLPVIVTYASPVGGMKAFKTHLDQNLRYPSAAVNENVKGAVKLGFTVTKNGKVRNIEVLKSLGYGCDEEAIRLLKTGPDWYPKRVEGVVEPSERTIKIKFKFD